MGVLASAAFDDLEVRSETVLTGRLEGDDDLHTVLTRLHDLRFDIVDVRVEDRRAQAIVHARQ